MSFQFIFKFKYNLNHGARCAGTVQTHSKDAWHMHCHNMLMRSSSCHAQAVTEFHVLLLYPMRLLALNAVSHAVVQDIALAGRGAPGYAGQPLALATDPATASVYLYTSTHLHCVCCGNELSFHAGKPCSGSIHAPHLLHNPRLRCRTIPHRPHRPQEFGRSAACGTPWSRQTHTVA